MIEENGKPIPGARVRLVLNHWKRGSSNRLVQLTTDAQGRYEIKAVPTGRKYSVSAEADGFGWMNVKRELDEDESGRVKIDPLVLAPANLSISGVVVDADGKPVPNVRVEPSGQGQPYRIATTDKEGKFVLDKIIAGEIQVSANTDVYNRKQYGVVMAKGGDKDVKIVLDRSSGSRPPKPKFLLGKPLPKLETFSLKAAAGKRLLICFWDFEQRPSRRTIRILAAKADELAKKGVIVMSVQASATNKKRLQDWAAKYKVALPIGIVPTDEKKARKILLEWGVVGLPWLILTDDKHVVRAEGFQVTELGAKLKEVGTLNTLPATQPDKPDYTPKALLEAIRKAYLPAKTMRVEMTIEKPNPHYIVLGSGPAGPMPSREEQKWSALVDGDRSRIECEIKSYEHKKDDEPYKVQRERYVFDGKKYRKLFELVTKDKKSTSGIQDTRNKCSQLILKRLVGVSLPFEGLTDPNVLKKYELTVEDGLTPGVFVLIVKRPPGVVYRLTVDGNRGFQVVKIETLDSNGRKYYEINFKLRKHPGGFWYTAERERERYSAKTGKGFTEERVKFTKVELKIDVPPGTFTLKFPPGTKVWDCSLRDWVITGKEDYRTPTQPANRPGGKDF